MDNATPRPLPPLRDDLRLAPGPVGLDGAPTWTIFDPVRNRYFRIGWLAFQMLSRWSQASANEMLERMRLETTAKPTQSDVDALIQFLYANNLSREPATGAIDAYVRQWAASRPPWVLRLLYHYLFFRIPLLRPDRWLRRALPWIEPLYRRSVLVAVLMLGLIGVFLASRQWDVFVHTFAHFFNLQGLVFYALALIGVKILHEFGHAFTATRYGCRVPTMGIAFLVMFPVLYTDATDAWKLESQRQRMLISSAGIITELCIALLATFAWSFLPDGVARSIAFFVATTSWVLSLAVNLNPFLRFDGYYILSDWLGVANLQERSFRLARWKLRELLFGVTDAVPEVLPAATRRLLVGYAWFTWVYRFALFIVIALFVYHLFFKLLGLVLFAAEILWLIVLPVWREVVTWWRMRDQIKHRGRVWISAAVVGALLVVFLVPWSTHVSFPALLEPQAYTTVFAPSPGRIAQTRVVAGQTVRKGEILLVLDSPFLDGEARRADKRIEVHELKATRQAGDADALAELRVVLSKLEAEKSLLGGIEARRQRLVIRAPIGGVVTDLTLSLHTGRWINERLALMHIVDAQGASLTGVASEQAVGRIAPTAPATFYPEDAQRERLPAKIETIEAADVGRFDFPYLASLYDGDVAVRRNASGELVAEATVYRVRLRLAPGIAAPVQVVRGTVHVQSARQSLAERVYTLVASVLIREAGF